MTILKYFPAKDEPRDSQKTALQWLQQNKDKKYFFLNIPVGGGKSHIGVTFGNYLKSLNPNAKASFILTPQISLQKQYEESFKREVSSLYGKSNYNCLANMTSCDVGSLYKPPCQKCPNNIALSQAINSDHAVMNYKLGLIKFTKSAQFEKRNLMVFDECHQLEKVLIDSNTVNISKELCAKHSIKWLGSTDLLKIHEWLMDDYWPKIEAYYRELEGICNDLVNGNKPSSSDVETIRQYDRLSDHLAVVQEFIQEDLDDIKEKYIASQDDTGLIIRSVYGASAFHSSFRHMADKFLFLSATIFDYEEICKYLDIPLEETCFLSLESEFPKENRPVVFMPSMKMSYGWEKNADGKKKIIDNLKNILKNHPDESGIIHTGNFSIAKWIVSELKYTKSHEILHHNPGSGDNRNKIIESYIKSKKPSILISPSITEGLDLYDDKARFVIFAKVTYGQLADDWIKHRMNLSNNWYMMNALTDVMQGCGRVVRHKDDFGVVYILDESFNYLFNKTSHKIPKWWMEAFHRI